MKKAAAVVGTVSHFDVISIGSGGGVKLSTPASKMGLRAAIIEKDRLGGTCLNRGCIPSKMLIHPAEVAHTINDAARYFIHPQQQKCSIDFADLVTAVNAEIDQESNSILPMYRKNENLSYFHGTAKFVGERKLEVATSKGTFTLTGDKIFIATGSRPMIPNISGLNGTPYLTSQEALRLTTQPKKLIVIGGGYIACELAFYFAALGTEVHVLVRSSMLKGEDEQVSKYFKECFAKRVHLHIGHEPVEVKFTNGTFATKIRDVPKNQTYELASDQLLVAAGVIPNSDNLGLEAAGVHTKKGNFIQTDEFLRTTAPNVWAFGDVIGNYLFRHSVNKEGEYLFRTVVQNTITNEPMRYGAMPHAVFSSPQVAGVGKTEQQLRAEGAQFIIGFCRYVNSAMGMAMRNPEGFVKLLIAKPSRKIVGAHIIGEHASILLHQLITLMELNGTLDQLMATTFIHPALNEVVRNAGRDALAKLEAA